ARAFPRKTVRAGTYPAGGGKHRERPRSQPRGGGAGHHQDGRGIFPSPRSMKISAHSLARILGSIALLSLGASCVSPDRRHEVIVSIPEQRMALLEDGAPLATYPVSTSK